MVAGYSSYLDDVIPITVQVPIGIILLIVSGYMAKTGLSIVFSKDNPPTGVTRKGVFGIVRHPIYFSEVLLYLGLLVIFPSLAAVGVWIIAICFLLHISRYEEKLLLAKFGEEYE